MVVPAAGLLSRARTATRTVAATSQGNHEPEDAAETEVLGKVAANEGVDTGHAAIERRDEAHERTVLTRVADCRAEHDEAEGNGRATDALDDAAHKKPRDVGCEGGDD